MPPKAKKATTKEEPPKKAASKATSESTSTSTVKRAAPKPKASKAATKAAAKAAPKAKQASSRKRKLSSSEEEDDDEEDDDDDDGDQKEKEESSPPRKRARATAAAADAKKPAAKKASAAAKKGAAAAGKKASAASASASSASNSTPPASPLIYGDSDTDSDAEMRDSAAPQQGLMPRLGEILEIEDLSRRMSLLETVPRVVATRAIPESPLFCGTITVNGARDPYRWSIHVKDGTSKSADIATHNAADAAAAAASSSQQVEVPEISQDPIPVSIHMSGTKTVKDKAMKKNPGGFGGFGYYNNRQQQRVQLFALADAKKKKSSKTEQSSDANDQFDEKITARIFPGQVEGDEIGHMNTTQQRQYYDYQKQKMVESKANEKGWELFRALKSLEDAGYARYSGRLVPRPVSFKRQSRLARGASTPFGWEWMNDLWQFVFSNLGVEDLRKMRLVCRKFNRILMEGFLKIPEGQLYILEVDIWLTFGDDNDNGLLQLDEDPTPSTRTPARRNYYWGGATVAPSDALHTVFDAMMAKESITVGSAYPPGDEYLSSHGTNQAANARANELARTISSGAAVIGKEEDDAYGLFQLYESIRPPNDAPQLMDPKGLSCKLRPFQRQALLWAYLRETGLSVSGSRELHPLWTPVQFPLQQDGSRPVLYYNVGAGVLSANHFSTPITDPGGLLCEEMGLGKTVETCSLILSHRRPKDRYRADFTGLYTDLQMDPGASLKTSEAAEAERITVEADAAAAAAAADDDGRPRRSGRSGRGEAGTGRLLELPHQVGDWQPDPIPVGATLIITPQSILHQWFSELQKNMPEMKVFHYVGMGKEDLLAPNETKNRPVLARGKTGGLHFDPATFEQFDIVLTTYNVLQADLKKHTKLRPTPLICVEWWRIVLDEAQMVSNSNSETAHMAACLYAANRWCVTGTPISNKLDDLFGLLDFMYHVPFSSGAGATDKVGKSLWNNNLLKPYYQRSKLGLESMRRFLRQVMWRHTKDHVMDQLGLPPLKDNVVKLQLTDTERLYYDHTFRSLTRFYDSGLGRQGALSQQQLLRLRQACCSMLLGGVNETFFGHRLLGPRGKAAMLPSDALKVMKRWALRENEGAVRTYLYSNNSKGSMYANPQPYEQEDIDPDTGQRMPVCEFPPKKDLTRALYIFRETLDRIAEFRKQRAHNGDPIFGQQSLGAIEYATIGACGRVADQIEVEQSSSHVTFKEREQWRERRGILDAEFEFVEKGLQLPPVISAKRNFPGQDPEKVARATLERQYYSVRESRFRIKQIRQFIAAHEEFASALATSDAVSEVVDEDDDATSAKSADSEPERVAHCLICSEIPDGPTSLGCGHTFCHDCIVSWIEGKEAPACPAAKCRKPIAKDLLASLTSDAESAAAVAAAATSAGVKKLPELVDVAVYGTKITALIGTIRALKMQDPEAKFVIFSQFSQMLTLAYRALKEAGVGTSRLEGDDDARREAVKSFQTDPDVAAFLISMKWSAGLTLTQAAHVFLLEPSLNPGSEAQATNRVYRIGQTKETNVWRFVIEDSVEERIVDLQTKKQQLGRGADVGADSIQHEDGLREYESALDYNGNPFAEDDF